MSKKRRNNILDTGAPLPENVETDKRMCVCLCIPNEPEYRQAFRGQLASLGQWFFWEKGGGDDRRAKKAAELWRQLLYEDLQMPCGCGDTNKLFRFNEDGELESSTDGGTTWNPDPSADPRLTAPLMPPLPGEDGVDKRCEAANNATSHIKAKADDLIADSAAWGNISGLLAGILALLVFLSIIGSGGALTPLALGLAGSLLGIGSAAFAAAMTEEVYERLNCSIYCHMADDGSVSPAAVILIQADIDANETGVAHKFLHDVVGMMGSKGLTNMGRTDGVASTFECEDCECVPPCESADTFSAGNVISQVDNMDGTITFTVESVDNGSGVQYIAWGNRTGDENQCCMLASIVTIIGGGSPGGAVQGCGTLEEVPVVPLGGNCYHYWHYYHDSALTTPFTSEVTIGGDCT